MRLSETSAMEIEDEHFRTTGTLTNLTDMRDFGCDPLKVEHELSFWNVDPLGSVVNPPSYSKSKPGKRTKDKISSSADFETLPRPTATFEPPFFGKSEFDSKPDGESENSDSDLGLDLEVDDDNGTREGSDVSLEDEDDEDFEEDDEMDSLVNDNNDTNEKNDTTENASTASTRRTKPSRISKLIEKLKGGIDLDFNKRMLDREMLKEKLKWEDNKRKYSQVIKYLNTPISTSIETEKLKRKTSSTRTKRKSGFRKSDEKRRKDQRERSKRYRERKRADKEAFELERRKEHERYLRRKAQKKIKLISELTKKEQKHRRAIWKNNAKKCRARKKAIQESMQNL